MNASILRENAMHKMTVDSSMFQNASSRPSITRGLIVIPFSLIITLGLLLCMYALIKNDGEYIEPPTEAPKIMDFVMKEVPPIKNEYTKLERPTEPDIEPPKPQQEFESITPVAGPGIIVERMKPPVSKVTPANFGGDQLMPLIKVQPTYPTTASTRGIEGFVDVVFDVTAIGTTENIRIAYAEPSSVFNRSVIQAIQGWKYKPQLVDGNPVKAFDVRERITFEFDE